MDKPEKQLLIGLGILIGTVVIANTVGSIRTHVVESQKRKAMRDLTERTKAAYAQADTPAKIRLVTKLFQAELDNILNPNRKK
jgi:hypothetical protein